MVMNWQVLRDKKTFVYFLLSFVLFIVAIGFAMKDNSAWVILVVVGNIIFLCAVVRAQKKTYQTKGDK